MPISMVNSARLISKGSERRTELIYRVPIMPIKGPILHISFTRSDYLLFEVCTLDGDSA